MHAFSALPRHLSFVQHSSHLGWKMWEIFLLYMDCLKLTSRVHLDVPSSQLVLIFGSVNVAIWEFEIKLGRRNLSQFSCLISRLAKSAMAEKKKSISPNVVSDFCDCSNSTVEWVTIPSATKSRMSAILVTSKCNFLVQIFFVKSPKGFWLR